jgi:hypothetical protein
VRKDSLVAEMEKHTDGRAINFGKATGSQKMAKLNGIATAGE